MLQETRSRKIGDCTYTITLLPAGQGLTINALLYRALGPSLAEMAANLEGDFSLADLPWAAITAAVKELTIRLDEADLRTLCTTFAATTEVTLPDGKTKPRLNDVFDSHFAGKYARMYQWLFFCLQENFADFLEVVQPLLRKAPPAQEAG
jgi:hypothetical protein